VSAPTARVNMSSTAAWCARSAGLLGAAARKTALWARKVQNPNKTADALRRFFG
jgi:hypothetical protein